MDRILPYNKEIINIQGGFFYPNGEPIISPFKHEKFAREYCYGFNYDNLNKIILSSNELFEKWKKNNNFLGNREDIDLFSSSKLSKEELKLFKLWIQKPSNLDNTATSFLIRVCDFDKVQIRRMKAIVTTHPLPYKRFWNYILMDWYIDIQLKQYYNSLTKAFEEYDRETLYLDENAEYQEQLVKTKSKVPINERYKYFK